MAEPAKTNGATNVTPAPTGMRQATQLEIVKKSVVDVVKLKVNEFISSGELFLPKNYSPDNAMKAAWLILQSTVDKDNRRALEVCTRDSIANALLDMVVQGLNPLKKQNYFIVYGKTLTCQRSYFGSMAVAQMVEPRISEFAFAVVYEGDTFKYGIHNGKKHVTEHEQDIQNVDKKKIMAAYCIALNKEGDPFRTEIMTIDEIKQAWKQSKMNPIDDKGNIKDGSTHGKFAADMAMKTVINKCCKAIINASSDNALLLDKINRNEDLADRAAAEAEIEAEANQGEVLEIEAAETTGQEEAAEQPQASDTQAETGISTAEEPKAATRMPGF